ncbi:hypothetical protein MKJ04_04090 [Pontibacter sp. E15-1]|uniref:hypothetical protein n=1 Tax=Pontibacter sp. E15-1 TaxID=2919918 RepID=UPI001F4F5640|nr:hypothetical protein [Pontibacter sp. E15-1]MCJ8164009.1 hypothetical protein [Pontibacter sp. E15-1]
MLLVESSLNLGFTKGNNLGLKYASGKTILLLNSDTGLLNNSIALAYRRLLASEKVRALTGKVITPAGKVQHVSQRFPSITLVLLQVLRHFHLMSASRRSNVFLGEYFKYDEEANPDWIWATFFLIRREAVAAFQGGKFPEEFFMYEEDKLWGYYLQQNGYKLLYTPLPLVLHHVSGSSPHREDEIATNKIILQNEFQVIVLTKGIWYARVYFLLKALQYFTSGYTHAKPLARLYWRVMRNFSVSERAPKHLDSLPEKQQPA